MSLKPEPTNLNVLRAPPRASSNAVRRVMQGNRKRDTRPEVALRRALHGRGLRYRIDVKIGKGRSAPRPDIVFPRAQVGVFLHGCYWHGCPEHGVQPRTNPEYWRAKIQRNQARDAANVRLMEEHGWLVLVVWEHEAVEVAADRIVYAVHARLSTAVGSD